MFYFILDGQIDGQTDGQTSLGKNIFQRIAAECYKSSNITYDLCKRHYVDRILKNDD